MKLDLLARWAGLACIVGAGFWIYPPLGLLMLGVVLVLSGAYGK